MIPFCRISWEIWKEGGNMLKKIVGWFGLINLVVFITVFKRPKKKYEYVKYDRSEERRVGKECGS